MTPRYLFFAAIFCLSLPAFAAETPAGGVTPAPAAAVATPPPAVYTPPAETPLPPAKPSDFERLPNGDVRIGQVTLHRKTRQISFPGEVVMAPNTASKSERGGIIDVLIASNKGRLYEAVFSSEAVPSQLQAMLILLGLNNGPRLPDAQGKQGDVVDVDVEWKRQDGTIVVEPIENFLQDTRTNETLRRTTGWVFTGTMVQGGVPSADVEGNIVLSWSYGSTILDASDPDSAKANLFIVNPTHPEPPLKTPVRFVIIPRKKAAVPAAVAEKPAASPAATPGAINSFQIKDNNNLRDLKPLNLNPPPPNPRSTPLP